MSAAEQLAGPPDRGLLRFLTCGSVDDGKSTLIGRLLVDTRSVLADALSAIERTSRRRGLTATDLSLLTDGLSAEREQGITIDVAYRSFSTGTRKYIIADAPGHEQYTRNMVTAGSTAHLAVLLVDARKGVLTQTRRHAVVAHQLGIPHLVVAVNKMDLVGWSAEVFAGIQADFLAFAGKVGIADVRFIPLSALTGDMVVERGSNLGWWRGPTLLELLEAAPAAHTEGREPFRFPVQWVCRPHDGAHHDFRGFAGRVESGRVAVGDEVQVVPSGRTSRIKAIWLGEVALREAAAEQSVLLQLEDEVDLSRGDLLAHPAQAPAPARTVEAVLCWLSERPLSRARRYLVRHTTRESRAQVGAIAWRLDLAALEQVPAETLAMNDIGRVTLKLAQPLAADPYRENRATGAFIVIDEASNDTVGAGMILVTGPAADLAALSSALEGLAPEEILAAAAARHPGRLALACSFGAEDCLLVSLVARARLPIELFTLDTGYLFPETYALWRALEGRYGITIRAERTALPAPAPGAPPPWEVDADACCDARKVMPLRAALARYDGWITGIRRDQTPERAGARVLEWDGRFGLEKVNPLAAWTGARLEAALREGGVPVNPLHARGYLSIGCAPCTSPVRPGEDPRAGRWRGSEKQECGLHWPRRPTG